VKKWITIIVSTIIVLLFFGGVYLASKKQVFINDPTDLLRAEITLKGGARSV
jgi:hypothetical protein